MKHSLRINASTNEVIKERTAPPQQTRPSSRSARLQLCSPPDQTRPATVAMRQGGHLSIFFLLVLQLLSTTTNSLGSLVKNPPPASVEDPGSIPGLGISPGEGNCSQLQDSCLENPMDRGAWRDTVHGVTESDTSWRLSNNHPAVSALISAIKLPSENTACTHTHTHKFSNSKGEQVGTT